MDKRGKSPAVVAYNSSVFSIHLLLFTFYVRVDMRLPFRTVFRISVASYFPCSVWTFAMFRLKTLFVESLRGGVPISSEIALVLYF